MSRIGNKAITIPAGVEVSIASGNEVTVKGPKGTLVKTFSPLMEISVDANVLTVKRPNEEKHTKQLHGTTNSLISNMIKGVSEGFKKELEIKGVGYKATLKGTILELAVGYSHLVNLDIPQGLTVVCPKPTEITISGIEKELVGHFASIIHDVRRPSPYSGKGIAYKGEKIRRKEGKTASK